MKIGGILLRVMFALWLCLGTQVHIALDHTALDTHVSHHALEPLDAAHHIDNHHHADDGHDHAGTHHHHDAALEITAANFGPPVDTRCCIETPRHHHHNNGIPHAHLAEALHSGSQRNLPFAHAAVLPLRAIASLPETAPLPPFVTVPLPTVPPASHNAALRAPPRA